MFSHDHHTSASSPPDPALLAQLDALTDGLKKLLAQASAHPRASRLNALRDKVTALIKAYPLRAAAIALGAGYLVTRRLRR